MPARKLVLAGFPIGIAQVACSLSRRLVFDHACHALRFRFLAGCRLCLCSGLLGHLPFSGFHFGTCLLFRLCALARDASFLPRRGNGCAFRLAGCPGWFVGYLCCAVGIQQCCFGIG